MAKRPAGQHRKDEPDDSGQEGFRVQGRKNAGVARGQGSNRSDLGADTAPYDPNLKRGQGPTFGVH